MWLSDHGGEIEADLLRDYGVDLLDWWRGRLTVRRLCVLVFGLGSDAALWRALNDDTPAEATPGGPRQASLAPVVSLRDARKFMGQTDNQTG